MSFFSLKDLFIKRKTPPPEKFTLPYNLKPSEWNALRTFRNDESFDLFLRTLDEVVKLNGELLLNASKDESLHFYRGVTAGIRKAAFLIDEISAAQTLHEEQERKRKDARITSDRTRNLSTFGTSEWSPRGP